MALKQFFTELWEILKSVKEQILLSLGFLLVVSQIAVIGSFAVRNQDEKAVIYAKDNDAGAAIGTAMNTRWWNSNRFAPYGPLYFRLSHTIAELVPYSGAKTEHPLIQEERRYHLGLQLASLVAVYGLAYLLCAILFQNEWQRWLGVPVVVSALTTYHWANMIMRPHPDLVLAFTTGLATFLTAKWIFEEKPYFEKLAALAWGVAVGTKATIILFSPAFLFLFFPWKKENLLRLLKFVGWMFAGYTIIGFPQSLSYFKVIKFLWHERHVSLMADGQSVSQWFRLMGEQLWIPVLVVIGFVLTTTNFRSQFKTKASFKVLIFALIPILVLLTRKQAYSVEHFTIPFVTCFLVGFAYVFRRAFEVRPYPFFMVALFFIPLIPPSFETGLEKNMICRSEARTFAGTLKKLQAENHLVLHDPYIPVSMVYEKSAKQIWGFLWQDVKSYNPEYLALNRFFYQRYFVPPGPQIFGDEVTEWPKRGDFYRAFADHDTVTSPEGVTWKKIFDSTCNFELWEKQKAQ